MFPDIYWAQRSNATEADKNFIYLTVKVADLSDEVVDISDTKFSFKGVSGATDYSVSFEFFEEIDSSKSKQSKTGQGVSLILYKKKAQEEYWPRLTKDKVKKLWLHTDFDKWVDEDEQEEQGAEPDMGDMSSMMGGAGGAGGAGGMDMAQMAQLQQMLGGMGGGAGGADGAGGLDMASLMAGMGGAGAADEAGAPGAADIEEAEEDAPEEVE